MNRLKVPYVLLLAVTLFSLCLITACGGSNSGKKKDVKAVDSTEVKLTELNAKIKSSPNDADLYIERCKLLIDLGKYQAGFFDAKRAVGIDSMKAENWLEYGKAAFACENYYRSEEGYLRCIALAPENTDCLIKMSEFLLLRKKFQESINYANKALEVNDELARPYYIKGWVYMESRDTVKAVTSFQTAIELDANFYDAFIQLGGLMTNAKSDIALDYFNSAISVEPKNVEAYYFKGMFLQGRHRTDEAIAVYHQILQIDSLYPMAYYNIGYLKLTEENKPDSAIDYFSKAIKANPSYYEAYYNRGYCNELLGNKAKASNDYKLALTFNSQFDLAAEGLDRVQ